MINNDTVLVLGAGASMDYGFPSGEQLIEDIINYLEGKIQEQSDIKKIFVALILYKHFQKNKIEKTLHDCFIVVDEFISTFKNASPASIDDFLDKNTREEFKIIGKICVVIAISRCEDSEADFMTEWKDTDSSHRYFKELQYIPYKLNDTFPRGHLELIRGWYNYLWKKIYEGDIKNNLTKLTFITFNYDRSLERFLYTRLINLLNLKEDNAIELFNESVVIHHVYGQLGFLKWQKDCKVINDYKILDFGLLRYKLDLFCNNIVTERFADDLNSLPSKLAKEENDYLDKFLSIAGEIRTYTEAVEKPHPKISKRILNTKRIFFLGFGYHKQNLKWLNPDGKKIKPVLAGTTYKFGKAQTENIERLFRDTVANTERPWSPHHFNKYFRSENNEYKIQDYFANVLDLE